MTIYDIAREAGVSIATVSRVLGGSGKVSGATRARVEAVLARTGYAPNPAARGLAAGAVPAPAGTGLRGRFAALLAEEVRDPSCAEAIFAAQRRLLAAGVGCLFYSTGGGAGVSVAAEAAKEAGASALLVAGMGPEGERAVAAFGGPAVVVGHAMEAAGVCCVVCDEAYGMMLAVGQLAADGASDILYVRDTFPEDEISGILGEGFEAGMAMNGLSAEGRVVQTERGPAGGFAAAEALLRGGRRPNGVVCGDDTTAAGFMRCLNENFLQVPEDVFVVGFHNAPAAECAFPPLTTVDCRPAQAGEAAGNLLAQMLGGERPPALTPILPRLVRRGTA